MNIEQIIIEAQNAAHSAAESFFYNQMGGQDGGACGFSWVSIYELNGIKLKGNTKAGKMLKKAGINQNYSRVFEVWNPSRFPVQSVDCLLAGSIAAADVFTRYGFKAYAGSRLD